MIEDLNLPAISARASNRYCFDLTVQKFPDGPELEQEVSRQDAEALRDWLTRWLDAGK